MNFLSLLSFTLRWSQTQTDGLSVPTALSKLDLSAFLLKAVFHWLGNNTNKNSFWQLHEIISPWVWQSKGTAQVYSVRSSAIQREVRFTFLASCRMPPVFVSLTIQHEGDSGTTNCFLISSGPFTWREMWMASLVFTRVKARRSEARLIFPHRPRVNDKWRFPFVIFGIFVDLFGGFCWIPRNGLWLKPILPISTLHLWNPSTGHLPSFRAPDTCLAGSSRHKGSWGGWERGGWLLFFFFSRGGRSWGRLKWMHSRG